MTTMAERRAAAAARIQSIAATVAPAKPRIRVRAGELVTEAMIKLALGTETAAQKLARWAESKREQHIEGGCCPHCKGTGRYRFHTDATRNEKCYRCDGKGTLNTKDLAFFTNRLKNDRPVCWVTTAAA